MHPAPLREIVEYQNADQAQMAPHLGHPWFVWFRGPSSTHPVLVQRKLAFGPPVFRSDLERLTEAEAQSTGDEEKVA